MLVREHAQKLLRLVNAFVSEKPIRHVNALGDGPLRGRSIAVKDNICTSGLPTRCGSRGLEPFVSPHDATVVARIVEAGGSIDGKTNMDEFGMGYVKRSQNYAYPHLHFL